MISWKTMHANYQRVLSKPEYIKHLQPTWRHHPRITTGNNVEGESRGLISDIILDSTWSDWGKAVCPAWLGSQLGASWIQATSVTAWANASGPRAGKTQYQPQWWCNFTSTQYLWHNTSRCTELFTDCIPFMAHIRHSICPSIYSSVTALCLDSLSHNSF
jgi:hypothetical protein